MTYGRARRDTAWRRRSVATVICAGSTTRGARRRAWPRLCYQPGRVRAYEEDHRLRRVPGLLPAQVVLGGGVGLRVDWIVYTRFAQRTNCDALLGAIVQDNGKGPRGTQLSIPYAGSGWVLVLPKDAPAVARFEDVRGAKGIGVQYSSWAHYILDTRKL